MRDAAAIAQFERRLAELACPPAKLRRKVRELADHHDDLVQAAREEGLSEADAATLANEQLGEPVLLAEQVAAVLRQSSWWGRHPVVGFCLLPPVGAFVMVCLGLALDFVFGRLYFPPSLFKVLADQPPDLKFLRFALEDTYYAALALTAGLFCWLAYRSTAGVKWALAACGICSFYGFATNLKVEPHSFAFGTNFPPTIPSDWIPVVLPLLVGLLVYVGHRRRVNRLAPLPVPGPPGSRLIRPRQMLPKTAWLTPTSAAAGLAVMAVITAFLLGRAMMVKRQLQHEELITKIWPAERAAVLQQLKARRIPAAMLDATPINLQPHVNAALADPVDGRGEPNANNLAELPRGVHVFAGVPFNVQGRVQLMGRDLLDTMTSFPVRARNIVIARKCTRIYLLHGAADLAPELAGTNIARLVLHYADGVQAQLPIVAGEHVLDWWGPIYQTGVEPRLRQPSAPGTELAWVGSNPAIQRDEPEYSLRLYRTTFENPRPEVEITSVDYVSTVTAAAPFLVGLTVE